MTYKKYISIHNKNVERVQISFLEFKANKTNINLLAYKAAKQIRDNHIKTFELI